MQSQVNAYDFNVTAPTTTPAAMQIVCTAYAKKGESNDAVK